MAQQVKIIGRGTWLDKVAAEVMEREKKLGRSLSRVRVESGLAASGLPHIGSVGDAIRSYGIKLALETIGHSSELVAYSDDFDGLRKVPAGLPDWLKDYIAKPVASIPDPFPEKCHESYGAHMSSLLRDALDQTGVEYTFVSGAEAYKTGLLTDQIRTILANADKVGRAIREIVGQEKYEKTLPYTPVCGSCGRLYTTHAYDFEVKSGRVLYKCEGTELGTRYLDGCGHSGEVKITEGMGKLVWKSEFAARWAALDIRFEAYGKELTDSVKINDWVAENILHFPPPYHVRYELFQDKAGAKMSKSVGNLVTPQEWMGVASPDSLRLLMYKRIIGARNISLDDIPVYMDEFDELEEYYFSPKRDANVLKDARQRGLYEYSKLLRIPKVQGEHVPYRLLTQLASAAPQERTEDYVVKRLISYGMVKQSSPQLASRIKWAATWAARKPVGSRMKPRLNAKLKSALLAFAESVGNAKTQDEIQAAAFESLKKNGLNPSDFFGAVYAILLGVDRGPRLGPYVMDAGSANVASKIKAAVSSPRHN